MNHAYIAEMKKSGVHLVKSVNMKKILMEKKQKKSYVKNAFMIIRPYLQKENVLIVKLNYHMGAMNANMILIINYFAFLVNQAII